MNELKKCCDICRQEFKSGLVHCLGIATCKCHQETQPKEEHNNECPMNETFGSKNALCTCEEIQPRCKSHPRCSHNTSKRSLDKPCSIEFKNPQPTWQKEFDKEFISDWVAGDLSLDEVRRFISQVEQQAIESERQRILEAVETLFKDVDKREDRVELADVIKIIKQ